MRFIDRLIDKRINDKLKPIKKEIEVIKTTLKTFDTSIAFSINQNTKLYKAMLDMYKVLEVVNIHLTQHSKFKDISLKYMEEVNKNMKTVENSFVNVQSAVQHLDDKVRFIKEEGE